MSDVKEKTFLEKEIEYYKWLSGDRGVLDDFYSLTPNSYILNIDANEIMRLINGRMWINTP